ncbi:MAG TPA: tripartite tricarboxylate transporter substrate binding protein [Burkholderiales bacterium]|nr:tripartite tricarboxylate transporter substrate binding protein [Burkholderiales bacterium]
MAALLAIAGALSPVREAAAQADPAVGTGQASYPSRPLRFIAANAPGGGLDIVARVVGPKLAAVFGQQVIVDNRAGAAGSIASEILAKSPPDGYTIMVASLGGLAVNTNLYKGLTYHPLRDFAPITWATSQSNVLVVHPSVPANSVRQLIALAKAKPNGLSYGSSGAGNAGHLAGELFSTMAGIKMVHVPYKGGAPAMVDLIAGQVQLVFSSAPTAVPQVKAGKIRGLAVTTAKRSAVLPELPTVAEAGLPGFEADNWYGIVTVMRTPRPIVDRLHAEIVRALQTPDVKQTLFTQGLEVRTSTPEEFGAYMKSEFEKWAKVIKDAGIVAN